MAQMPQNVPPEVARTLSEIHQSLTQKIQEKKVSNEIRVKCSYQGEKRVIIFQRPLAFIALKEQIRFLYGETLKISYCSPKGELVQPIETQEDLDNAVNLVENSQRLRSLSLMLFPLKDGDHQTVNGRYRERRDGNNSPPSGFLPQNGSRGRKAVKTKGSSEGFFEPEEQTNGGGFITSSREGSQSSLESSSCGRNTPKGSLRSVRSEPGANVHGSYNGYESSKGATYPKRERAYPPNNNSEALKSGSFPGHGRLPTQRMSIHSAGLTRRESSVSTDSNSSSGFGSTYDFSSRGDISAVTDLLQKCMQRKAPTSPKIPTNRQKGKLLGTGAFGRVYLCVDKETGQQFAMKEVLLDRENVETSKEAKALECEINLLRMLQHERIVQYYGSIAEPDFMCIFMEYMPGGSVRDHILQYGPMSENHTRNYTKQILEGLEHLHSLSIVHRDVKGANILRDHSGLFVKLSDFGTSKRVQTLSAAQTVIGTPNWMSPEVIQGAGYGRKADIWSLGCTVVEMLTGQPPWHGFEAMAVIFKIATCERPDYTLPKTASRECQMFVQQVFIKDPKERPSALELLKYSPFCVVKLT